jgi:hypothetical protein
MEEAKKKIAELKQLMTKHDCESIRCVNEIMDWFNRQPEDVSKVLNKFLIDEIDFVDKFVTEEHNLIIAEQMDEDLKRVIPLSYIAKYYFKKSAAWLSQRINGTPVRGKVYTLSGEQKETFNRAMRELGQKIGSFQIA